MASTLEWLCVRSPTPSFREFEVTPKQRHVGKAFGDFAYRFTLCHEMAHILCGHVDSASSAVHSVQHGNTDHTALLASHQQEHAADALALELQVKSLLDPSQVWQSVNAGLRCVPTFVTPDRRPVTLRPSAPVHVKSPE